MTTSALPPAPGGANLLHGEFLRDRRAFSDWQQTMTPLCDEPWHQISKIHNIDADIFPDFSTIAGIPPAIAARDRNIARYRDAYVNHDTVAARIYAACLQREILHFWLQRPLHALHGFARSYENFWLPVRYFTRIAPIPLNVEIHNPLGDRFHLASMLASSFNEPQSRFQLVEKFSFGDSGHFRRVSLFVIPTLGSLMSLCSAMALHTIPLLLAVSWWRRREIADGGIGFLVLMVGYVAGITSVVEYSENMRFRLAVEPLIWAVALLCLRQWLSLMKPPGRDVNTASGHPSAATSGTP